MTKAKMHGHKQQYLLDLDGEDMDDLLEIQLSKHTTIEETILACLHAGIVTIQTHCPRKHLKGKNHAKTEKSG